MRTRIAIIGSGKIGCDLLAKTERSSILECVAFIGRSIVSPGMSYAKLKNASIFIHGLDSLYEQIEKCDVVFDATSAELHPKVSSIAQSAGKRVISLTPSSSGTSCVPVLNGWQLRNETDINMISCGGQASIPIAAAIAKSAKTPLEYIETVSSISSDSAGMATRNNLDDYISTTERAIVHFSGAGSSKAILTINPATPSVFMQTTVYALIDDADLDSITYHVHEVVRAVQSYVPGYELVVEPFLEGRKLTVGLKIRGSGDYLPSHAGNLDIITSAAVRMAELISLPPH
ncbi:acetaldehyde dehydrogenase (acetylating) [Burkholderia glumae]|uniref:acetaldehyde dehydrogenase (acetylating) n=1 Tax=Burkholderia glumae TaxID=337 RepID=UPI0003A26715|nr:acetaldehyde dehydrogenase (acetylating) [Burkholderia glumae]